MSKTKSSPLPLKKGSDIDPVAIASFLVSLERCRGTVAKEKVTKLMAFAQKFYRLETKKHLMKADAVRLDENQWQKILLSKTYDQHLDLDEDMKRFLDDVTVTFLNKDVNTMELCSCDNINLDCSNCSLFWELKRQRKALTMHVQGIQKDLNGFQKKYHIQFVN